MIRHEITVEQAKYALYDNRIIMIASAGDTESRKSLSFDAKFQEYVVRWKPEKPEKEQHAVFEILEDAVRCYNSSGR